jgi:crotonobetainyl-CoA:carnitine CoA-transferase CaiB-like acyl-CoA transferase
MPEGGDDSRHFGPFKDGESAYFMLLNRGKKSMTLDLKSEHGRDILLAMVESCDVVIENFRPGVAKRLGLDYASLSQVQPSLIYASISGFGQEGPLADRPAYDLVVQAMSGLMNVTGQRNGPPTAVGESIIDVCTGMFAAWGISTALFDRERTGEGCNLDIAMLDSMFSMMLTVLSMQLYTDKPPKRVGSRHPVTYPVDVFETLDGYIVMVVTNDRSFVALSKTIGQPALGEDDRFRKNSDRSSHEADLKAVIEEWTSKRASADAVAVLAEAGIPAAPVLSVGELVESEHIAYREMISTVDHPTLGKVPLVHQPVRFSGSDKSFQRPPPLLGEHTRELLASILGLDKKQIDDLADQNVI